MTNQSDVPTLQNAIALASAWASNDETRENMVYVVVEDSRVWATDGHRALIVPFDADADKVGCYLDGVEVVTDNVPPPIDRATPAASTEWVAIMDAAWVLEELRTACGFIPKATLALTLGASDKESYSGPRIEATEKLPQAQIKKGKRPMKMSFRFDGPDARRQVCLNPHFLISAVEDLGFKVGGEVRLLQVDELSPIRIDGPRGYAIIMPMRM